MKKIILILLCAGMFACKTDEPCDIYDKDYSINLVTTGFSSMSYSYDSFYLYRKDTLYPYIRNDWGKGINIQLPPNQEVKDTFYLDWWNVPDRDTVVLEYKLSDEPCKTFEYEHAWFNGEYYRDFGNASQTFFFTKK